MISYPLPRFEHQRQEVMQRYKILNGEANFEYSQTAKTAALVFGMPIVIAALNERYRDWFRSAHGVNDRMYDVLQSFCAVAQLSEFSFVIEDARREEYFAYDTAVAGPPHVVFFAGVPLRDPDGKRFGTLCMIDHEPRTLTEDQMRIFQGFANMVSNEICLRSAGRYAVRDLIEVEEDKCALYDLATTDPLTGALNRRAFFHFTEREIRRASRHGIELSTMIFDIDHFKKVNDVHGHSVGDEVIRGLSRAVKDCIRDEDYLGRLGGEEFGLLLPETSAANAYRLAQRLRDRVKRLTFMGDGQSFGITISIGISSPKEDEKSIGPALDRADKALYQAKRNGRDRVEMSKEDAAESMLGHKDALTALKAVS